MPTPEQERLDAMARSMARLFQRQEDFAARLARLERVVLRTEESIAEPEPQPVAPPIAEPVAVQQPAIQAPPIKSEAVPPPARPQLETKLGLTVLNRVGVITLVLGVAFFFKWAVDNNWIGPAGRVMLGVVAGFSALALADFLWRKGQQIFAQGVTATGIAVLYISFYAAFSFYHLIPLAFAFILMLATTGMAVALSLRYDSQAIAVLGLLGGYLIPLLLNEGERRLIFLFSYILLLDLAAVGLMRKKNWRWLELASLVATIIVFSSAAFRGPLTGTQRIAAVLALLAYYALYWFQVSNIALLCIQFLAALGIAGLGEKAAGIFFPAEIIVAAGGLAFAERRRFPAALTITLASCWFASFFWISDSSRVVGTLTLFAGATFVFLLFFCWHAWRMLQDHEASTADRLGNFGVNAAIYFGVSYELLNKAHHAYLGPLAVAISAAYLAFGHRLYGQREKDMPDLRPVVLSASVALCFLTLAIPIQFTGFTITIAWALQAAALTWISFRFNSQRASIAAAAIFVLVAIRLSSFDSLMYSETRNYHLFWNARLLTFVIAGISLLGAAWWNKTLFRTVSLVEYFAGHIALLAGFSLEIMTWAARTSPQENIVSVSTVGISILTGSYALALVAVGVGTKTAVNRIGGLVFMALVILKLYLFDVWQLDRVYRISAFVALGILLISISFLYSKFRHLIEALWKDDDEVRP